MVQKIEFTGKFDIDRIKEALKLAREKSWDMGEGNLSKEYNRLLGDAKSQQRDTSPGHRKDSYNVEKLRRGQKERWEDVKSS